MEALLLHEELCIGGTRTHTHIHTYKHTQTVTEATQQDTAQTIPHRQPGRTHCRSHCYVATVVAAGTAWKLRSGAAVATPMRPLRASARHGTASCCRLQPGRAGPTRATSAPLTLLVSHAYQRFVNLQVSFYANSIMNGKF